MEMSLSKAEIELAKIVFKTLKTEETFFAENPKKHNLDIDKELLISISDKLLNLFGEESGNKFIKNVGGKFDKGFIAKGIHFHNFDFDKWLDVEVKKKKDSDNRQRRKDRIDKMTLIGKYWYIISFISGVIGYFLRNYIDIIAYFKK